ncbi:hypothetical protein FEK30_00450 (plasmid) [Picosynechococcus sp. PCC 11901]|uniref:hypothetical protein n=1 Tax=Picosynechococcus sp. PCC 11901 TaxID=2579791 RepID=UPI0010FC1761|nr:hypothetical protein [Picosynechococcus sp. PCC 11901]QCS48034.1 hypothetical protein FEK30_00450 [Picosynechococcus sp. PCC 11901]
MGFTYRTDLTIHNGQLFDGHGQFTDHLAYCSESRLSLTRPINNLLDRGAGCFIDEFDQQLKNLLMSATHGRDGQRQTNIQNFWQDTIRAKETLGVSADLTDFEVKLFEKHTGRKPFVVKVEHVKKQRIDTVFEHEAQWCRSSTSYRMKASESWFSVAVNLMQNFSPMPAVPWLSMLTMPMGTKIF